MSQTRQQRRTGRPRAGGPPPPPSSGEDPGGGRYEDHSDHEHLLKADPGWWALFAWEDGVALPVVCWLMEPGGDDEAPGITGLVPGGFGTWDCADTLSGFVDYAYRSERPPSADEVRVVAERVVRRYRESDGDDRESWEPLEDVRVWLRGRPR